MSQGKKSTFACYEKYDPILVDRLLNHVVNPFVFSYRLDSWPAFSLWTPSFFKETYGDQIVDINPHLPDKAAPYLYNMDSQTTLMKLKDFIDLMLTNRSCYLAEAPVETFQGLEEQQNLLELIPPSEREKEARISLWMGANTRSGLHFDMLDNFLVQVYGIKKFVLIPPEDIRLTYPIPSHFSKSPINPLVPDLKRFPKFKKAHLFKGELKPGDALFIPKGWYHYLYAPQQSISLNCFYGKPFFTKDLLCIFFKAGWKPWVATSKDFLWHGLLSRPYEGKLFCPNPFGKVLYDRLLFFIKHLRFKYILKSKSHLKETL
ncbi:MAG: cupin-like domain-containing protein [Alphaproteobacteria bacterium]|nr:cupin-like domain-containing protein [Alphaproteobacteria bacterium]